MSILGREKYISLKEASKRFGYAPDYIGFLIRKGKIQGRKIYSNVSWQVDTKNLIKYCESQSLKPIEPRDSKLTQKKYLTLKEAASFSGYSSDYIGYLIRAKKIKGKKINSGVSWLVNEEVLRQYLESGIKKKDSRRKYSDKNRAVLLGDSLLFVRKEISLWTKTVRTFLKASKYGTAFSILGIIVAGALLVWAVTPKNPIQTIEIFPVQFDGDWQNSQNAMGPPDVSENGDFNSFSELNSAAYQQGLLSLIVSDFSAIPQVFEGAGEEIQQAQPTPELSITPEPEGNTGGQQTENQEEQPTPSIQNENLEENQTLSETPSETPMESLVETPVETPTEPLLETPLESQAEIPIETLSESETPLVTPLAEEISETPEPSPTELQQIEEISPAEEILNNPELPADETQQAENSQQETPTSFFQSAKKFIAQGLKNIFGNIVKAKHIPNFDELKEKEFVSAKIRLSFAIGEKSSDLQPVADSQPGLTPELSPEPSQESSPEPTPASAEASSFDKSSEDKPAGEPEITPEITPATPTETPLETPSFVPLSGTTEGKPLSFWGRVKRFFALAVNAQDSIPPAEITPTPPEQTPEQTPEISPTESPTPSFEESPTPSFAEASEGEPSFEEPPTPTLETSPTILPEESLIELPEISPSFAEALEGKPEESAEPEPSMTEEPQISEEPPAENPTPTAGEPTPSESTPTEPSPEVTPENSSQPEESPQNIISNLDAKIIIWYSLDGQVWQQLDIISSYPLSNFLNPSASSGQGGGYFEYEAPFLTNWGDVKNLKIKFEGVVGGETQVVVYLDSVWVEASYKEKEEEEEFELRAVKKDWRADEEPEFEVVLKNQNILESAVNQMSSIFAEEPRVKAHLLKPGNEDLELEEDKDFSAETHSPTRIKLFKQNLRPGKHTLNVEYEKDGKIYNLEQDFTWGVLAINTNKSIYLSAEALAKADLPPETAYLQMGALNDSGHTLCNADLKLEITSPDGGTTVFLTSSINSLIDTNNEPTDANFGVDSSDNAENNSPSPSPEPSIIPAETAESESLPVNSPNLETPAPEETAVPTESPATIETPLPTESVAPTESPIPTESTEAMESPAPTESAEPAEPINTPLPSESLQVEPSSSPLQEAKNNSNFSASLSDRIKKFLGISTVKAQGAADDISSFGVIERSSECNGDSVTSTPDYFAYYQIGGAGVYKMKLTNLDNGYSIDDSFEVRDWVPFEVERIGPTRIYPPATYKMKMIVKVNQDFVGKVIESVPASFDVLSAELTLISTLNNPEGEPSVPYGAGAEDISENPRSNQRVSAEITIANNEKLIIWNTNLEKGNTYELRYQFDAPDISPYLYLLGPLQFKEDNAALVSEYITQETQDTINNVLNYLGAERTKLSLVQRFVQTGESANLAENSSLPNSPNVSDDSRNIVFQEARQPFDGLGTTVFQEIRSWQIAADSPAFTARTETAASGASLTTPFSFTINKATGVVDGDIMFMFLAIYIATPPTVDSIPSGWELVATNTTTNSRWYLYWKLASGEGASYTWSLTASCRYYALNVAYSAGDFDVASLSDITAISNTLYPTAGTTVRAASMSVPVVNSPLVYFGAIYNTTVRTFTKPTAPTTDWVEDADQGGTTPDLSVTNGSMIWTGSGATGNMDIICSITITTYKHAFAIALNPAPPPPPADTAPTVPVYSDTPDPVAQTSAITFNVGWEDTESGISWTQQTGAAQWAVRYFHTSVVYNNPSGSGQAMWVIGGYNSIGPIYYNDVWYSANGTSWTLQTAAAQWAARAGHTSVVYDNPSGSGQAMWVIGGSAAGVYQNDVWYSANGTTWTRQTVAAQWAVRSYHTSLVYNNQTWVIGGYNNSPITYYNDIWYSTSGVTWTRQTVAAQWVAQSSHASVVYNNQMWVMGGFNGTTYVNNVWYSANGTSWTQQTAAAQWAARSYHASLVYNNQMWVIGGYNTIPSYYNDIWYSTSGTTWTNATAGAQWAGRTIGPASLVYNNQMWVIGGYTGSALNNVWYSSGEAAYIHLCKTNVISSPTTGGTCTGGDWNPSPTATTTVNYTSVNYTTTTSDTGTKSYFPYVCSDGGTSTSCSTNTPLGAIWQDAGARNDGTGSKDYAQWSARQDHTSLVYNNQMWVIGGSSKNDVWYSTNGTTWTQQTAGAQWAARQDHTSLVYNNPAGGGQAMWVMGGWTTTWVNDVWYSTNGTSWTQATAGAQWGARINLTSLIYNNQMWVMGGSITGLQNNVWYSTNGTSWTQQTAGAQWAARESHTSLVYNNQMWVIGGSPTTNDVWYSTNGTSWTQQTAGAQWGARYSHTSLVYNDQMWVIGGYDISLNYRNDAWYSTNGTTWTQQTAGAQWAGRAFHTSLVYNNQMWVMGGTTSSNFNDVWKTPSAGMFYVNESPQITSISDSPDPVSVGVNIDFTAGWDDPNIYQAPEQSEGISEQTPAQEKGTYVGTLWTVAKSNAQFPVRQWHTSVAFQSKLWVMGGALAAVGTNRNDVWYTTDGTTWTQQTAAAQWTARNRHGSVVFDSKIWVVGGNLTGTTTHYNDVWYSADGTTWLQATAAAQWGTRTTQMMLVHNSQMWVIGGWNASANLNDVWYSTSGTSWTRATAGAQWGARSDAAWIEFDNKMWILGGNNLNDVWYSTSGSTWTRATAGAQWALRGQHVGVSYNNKLWIFGGWTSARTNDVWYSADGTSWTQATTSAAWAARYRHSAEVYNNKIWVIAGETAAFAQVNDVWYADTEEVKAKLHICKTNAITDQTTGGTCTGGSWADSTDWSASTSLTASRTTLIGDIGTNNYWAFVCDNNGASNSCSTSTPGQIWIRAVANAQWVKRRGHTSLDYNDQMWVIGGFDATASFNDVWYSTNGTTWTQQTAGAQWGKRDSHTSLVYNSQMWVIGGYVATASVNDVWYSSNGASWTQATAGAQWAGRNSHTSLVYNDGTNKMWVIGGNDDTVSVNDVWYSTTGTTWTRQTAGVQWAERDSHTSLVYNSQMWVIGGAGASVYNDVWYSSNGISWTRATANSQWIGRYYHTSLVYNNQMWAIGGFDNSVRYNDVWYSTTGTTWTRQTAGAQWVKRSAHTSLVFNNQMWVMGGWTPTYYNDVWYSPAAGTFTVQAAQIAINGYVKGIDEDAAIGNPPCDDGVTEKVKIVVNGSTAYTTSCASATGYYTKSGITSGSGDIITVYLDTDGANTAVTVTKSAGANISGLNLYKDRLILRYETASLSNSDLAACDKDTGAPQCGDTNDLFFTSESNTLTLDSNKELHIWTLMTYNPSGVIVTQGTGDLHVDDSATAYLSTTGTSIADDVLVDDGASLNIQGSGASHTIGGNLTTSGTSAQVTYTNTPTLTMSGTDKAIGGGTTPSILFYSLTLSGTITMASATTTNNDLTVNGTMAGSASVTTAVNGAIAGSGTINMTGGKVEQRVAAPENFGTTSGTNSWIFYQLQFSNSSTASNFEIYTVTGSGGITVTNALTIGLDGDSYKTILFAGNRTWTISGAGTPVSISSTKGYLVEETSTFNYTGDGATTIKGETYYNLQAGNATSQGTGRTYTLGGNTTVSNVLTVGPSSGPNTQTLDASSYTVTLSATNTPFVINTYGLFTPSTSTVSYTGAGATNAASATYYVLDIGATSNATTVTYTAQGNVGANNQVTIQSGGSFSNGVSWTQQTAGAQWVARERHSSLNYDGKMWVIGGHTSTSVNDVWYSTNGTSWTQQTAGASWERRHDQTSLIFSEQMWVIGGYSDAVGNRNDVWHSFDGISWFQAVAGAQWTGRNAHVSLVYDNKMWVMGGDALTNDVWYSTNGITWTQATAAAQWTGRNTFAGSAYDGKMWIMGGWAGARVNDVWYSTNGTTWTKATGGAQWTGRNDHLSVDEYDNKMWLAGGLDSVTNQNDIWWSTNGASWTKATGGAQWTARNDFSFLSYNNKLWVIGATGGSDSNDVWYSNTGGVTYTNTLSMSTYNLTVGSSASNSGGIAVPTRSVFTQTGGTTTVSSSSGGSNTVGGSGSTTFYNFTVGNTSDNLSYTTNLGSAITVSNDLTIAGGGTGTHTLDVVNGSNYAMTVGGSWYNRSAFTSQAGRVTFNSTNTGEYIYDGTSPFYDLTFTTTGAEASWTYYDEGTAAETHSTTLTATSTATFVNARTGASPSVTSPATLNVDWYVGEHVVNATATSTNISTADSDLGANWTAATSTAQWGARYSHESLVYNNQIWVIGGQSSSFVFGNSVWYSTNGTSWTGATSAAQWSARSGHTSLTYNNPSASGQAMWVIGGGAFPYVNNVWYSTNGISWTQATAAAQWTARTNHTSLVYNNQMWVIGGYIGSDRNDVWYSTNGTSWTKATTGAQWAGRYVHISLVYNNQMWVMGGYNYATSTSYNNVWYSTNGISWTQATAAAQWTARYSHTSIIFNNQMWVMGGVGPKNDVWYSTNGTSWTQQTVAAQWGARTDHTSLVYNNQMWVMGGNTGSAQNDIWYDSSGNITISENTGTPATTLWWHNGTDWETATSTVYTDTDSTGKTPSPNYAGAVRLREYSMTNSGACPGAGCTLYLYNLQIAATGYSAYNYYSSYGSKYLTSCYQNGAACSNGNDDVIGASWHRTTVSSLNGTQDYSGLNEPPLAGSWYAGMSSAGSTISGNVCSSEPCNGVNNGSASCDGSTLNVKIVVDGSTSYTTDCDANTGAYSKTGVAAPANSIITVYLDINGGNNAVTVTRSAGANISGLDLYQNALVLRYETGSSIVNSDLAACDKDTGAQCADTNDLFFTSESNTLTLDVNKELHIWTTMTYNPNGVIVTQGTGDLHVDDNSTCYLSTTGTSIAANALVDGGATLNIQGTGASHTIGGNLTTSGTSAVVTYANSPTLTMSGNGKSIGGGTTPSILLYSLTLNSGGTGSVSVSSAISIDKDLTITGANDTLQGTGNVTVKGTVAGAGIINMTSTSVFQNSIYYGATNFGITSGTNNWTFYDLKFTNATTTNYIVTATTNSASITVTDVLTIGLDGDSYTTTLDAANRTFILSGAGTPFVISGTKGSFTENASTFNYTGNDATNITAETYYNLQAGNAITQNAARTYTLAGPTTVSSVLTIGPTTGDYTHILDASDETITLSGASTPFVVNAKGQFDENISTVNYTGNDATNITAETYYNLQAGNATSQTGSRTYTLAGDVTASNVLTIGPSSGDNTQILAGSTRTITLSGTNATPFVVNAKGQFNEDNSTVNYTNNTATNVTSETYYNLQIGNATTQSAGRTYTLAGDTTVSYVLTVGPSSGSNTQTLDASNRTLTLSGTGTPFVIQSKGSFTENTSTVSYTYVGDSATNVTAETYYTLGIGLASSATSTTFTAAGNVTCSKNLALQSADTGLTNTLAMATNNLTVGSSASNSGGIAVPTRSTLTQTGGTTKVSSSDNGSNTIGGAGTTTFYNFTIGNDSDALTYTSTLGGAITVSNDFTNTYGGSADTHTLDVGSNYAMTVGGSWYNRSAFTSQAGTVTFNSTTTGELIYDGTSPFYDLVFTTTGTEAGWTYYDEGTAAETNSTTLTATSTVTFVNARTGASPSVTSPATLNVDWYVGEHVVDATATSTNISTADADLGANWTQQTAAAQWLGRDGHTSVVYNNQMWVMGGNRSGSRQDIWSSSDGVTWTRKTLTAQWSARYAHASVVYDNKMWVTGGYTGLASLNDVWYSTDGVNWTRTTVNAQWEKRSNHAFLAYNNKMWLMTGGTTLNDVWSSTDGISWTQATAGAQWIGKYGSTSLVYNNQMWIMGGDNTARRNDVWYSTDGISWTKTTTSAQWSARNELTSVVYNNKMWVMAGAAPAGKNDVWWSTDGTSWTQATAGSFWVARSGQTSLLYNNRMWLMGGWTDSYQSDVWSDGSGNITLSENTGTPASTLWWHNGTDWETATSTVYTDTDSTGKTPSPNYAGAVRLREYSMTNSGACPGAGCTLYLYNLQIAAGTYGGTTYNAYNYYSDYGPKYLTSCYATSSTCSDDSSNDDVIGSSWHRVSISSFNGVQDYSGLNEPPLDGSWYVGMGTAFEFAIDSSTVEFGTIDPGDNPTNKSSLLTVTSGEGYTITAWSTQAMTCSDTGLCGSYTISDWGGSNLSPTKWDTSGDGTGFGYKTDDGALLSGTTDRFTNDTFCGALIENNGCWAGFINSGPGELVADRSGAQCPCTDVTNIIYYRLAASATQNAGPYQTVIVYVATVNY